VNERQLNSATLRNLDQSSIFLLTAPLSIGFNGIFEIVAADEARGGRLKKETRLRGGHRLLPLAGPFGTLAAQSTLAVNDYAGPPHRTHDPRNPIDLGDPMCPMEVAPFGSFRVRPSAIARP
jgi:hypothetical protein